MEINNELIEKLVKEAIEHKLDSYDISSQIIHLFRNILREGIESKVDKIIDKKIEEEIQHILDGEINIDDGWGRVEHWDNFEAMFKSKFNEKMNEDWEMKAVIEETVKKRLNKLFKEKTLAVTTKIQDMVLDEMLKD